MVSIYYYLHLKDTFAKVMKPTHVQGVISTGTAWWNSIKRQVNVTQKGSHALLDRGVAARNIRGF